MLIPRCNNPVFNQSLLNPGKRKNWLTVTPKSGEVTLQIAPMLATANMASMASVQLGRYPER